MRPINLYIVELRKIAQPDVAVFSVLPVVADSEENASEKGLAYMISQTRDEDIKVHSVMLKYNDVLI